MCPRPVPTRILLSAVLLAIAGPSAAANGPRPALPVVSRPAPPSPPILTAPSVAPVARAQIPVPDGRWHEFGLLQTENQAAFYEPVHDRLISLGGDRSGAWELPLAGTIAWRELASNPAQPWPVGWWGSEYDPVTGNLYFQAIGPNRTLVICRMDPTTGSFEPLWADGAPTAIQYMTVVFDRANQRFIVFGGQNMDTFQLPDDVWVLDLLPTPRWSKWTPAGTSPQGRIGAALILDAARKRLLVLGGLANVSPGVWALSLDSIPTWSRLAETALPGDANVNGMLLDTVADRVLALHSSGDVWAFSLRTNQWSILSVSGPRPPGRLYVPLVMDAARHRLLVAGGRSADERDLLNDVWALSLDGAPRWTPLVSDVTRPQVRSAASDGLDVARHRLVVFGGVDLTGRLLDDTWELDLDGTRWLPVAAQGTPPPGRYWHASAYDPVRDQLVVFGGYGSPDPPHNLFSDLWTLSFAGDAPTWTAHEPPGVRPAARCMTTMVYEPLHDRFIVMFGSDWGGGTFADVWELRFTPDAVWRQMAPSGSPVSRAGAMAVFDPARDRALVFGGTTATDPLDDTWALDLTTSDGMWYPITPALRPPARSLGLLQLDATNDRALLFGGEVELDFMNDVWELTLSGEPAWRELVPAGPIPAVRSRMVGAYDAAYERLVVACGGFWQPYNDTWALEVNEAAAPIRLTLTSVDAALDYVHLVWTAGESGLNARLERVVGDGAWQTLGTLTADAQGRIEYEDRDVTPGASLRYRLAVILDGEEFLLGLASVTVPSITVPSWSMALGVTNPTPAATFRLQLASGLPATLTVYDVTGRRVWSREVGVLGAGKHEVQATDMTWRVGVYFARLTQAGETRSVRFAVVR